MSKSNTALDRWTKIVELAGIQQDLRPRFVEALERISAGLLAFKDPRLIRVVVVYEHYEISNRRLPIFILADIDDEGVGETELDEALGEAIFHPILKDLRLIFPTDYFTPRQWSETDFGLVPEAVLFPATP